MKRYILYAGVNGAGKSTLYRTTHYKDSMPRVNTDEILREFGDWRNSSDLIKAGKIAVERLNDYLLQGVAFNQETTLCGHSIIRTMQRAKDAGYMIEMHYVGVDSPQIAKQRIAERVKMGGHGIPDQDVDRRYEESLKNLEKVLGLCDLTALYDNTTQFRRFAIYKNGKAMRVSHNIPAWYQKWMSADVTSVWKETKDVFNGEVERGGVKDEQGVVDMIKEMKEEIVLASVEDVKHVGNMYDAVNDYFEKHENYCYPNWQKGKYPVLEDAQRAMENQTLYVLKTEEGIAGAIIIDHTQHSEYKKISWTLQVPDESVMTMHTVVVAPDYRGRGFGEKLVRFGIDFCKNSGAKTIRLDTHYKNVPARQLYKKRGFVGLECHESFVESISL